MNTEEKQENMQSFANNLTVLEPDEKPRGFCPVCGSPIIQSGRCKTCYSCGWSSCDL